MQIIDNIYGLAKFPTTVDVGNGNMIIGHGPVGNDKRGPMIECEQGGFLFTGSGDLYNGTGGGIRNLKIFKKLGSPPDTAIKLTATSRERRCGETLLERLLIYGSGDSQGNRGIWSKGIHIDGTMLTTKGEAGIRTTVIDNVRIADCEDYALLLENAVHCKINGLQLDPGKVPLIKMRIDGGQNILGSNMVINGNIEIENTSFVTLSNLLCYGKVTIKNSKTVQLSGYINILEIDGTNIIINAEVNNLYVSKTSKGIFTGVINKTPSINSKQFGLFV